MMVWIKEAKIILKVKGTLKINHKQKGKVPPGVYARAINATMTLCGGSFRHKYLLNE